MRIRLQLFIINYPVSIVFSHGLMVIAVSSVKLRRIGVYGLLATTFWFSAWALNVYLIDLSPHWGQRELIKRYYEAVSDLL